jgi:hypothetical protein
LLHTLVWSVYSTPDDGAGGSAETKAHGTNGVGLRAYAWHGYNGAGQAEALANTTFHAGPYLTDDVPVARVELHFSATGNGVLKAPWDRSASIFAEAMTRGEFAEGPSSPGWCEGCRTHGYLDTRISLEAERELRRSFGGGATHSFLVTPEHPDVSFRFSAVCSAGGGPKALALLNEGYCDFYDQGYLKVDLLTVVVTPLPDYQIVDGRPVG